MKRTIGAIDIGTSKIVVLVGELDSSGVNIICHHEGPSRGLIKAEITDFQAASRAINDVAHIAEKVAKLQLNEVLVSISGAHITGSPSLGTVNVTSGDRIVSHADMRQARKLAVDVSPPPGRVYLAHLNNGYVLDGRPVAKPIHLQGERLESRYLMLTGDQTKVTDVLRLINATGLTPAELCASCITSGFISATEEQKQQGVLVLDIGAGATGYSLYRQGMVCSAGYIPVGGEHFTNDLAIGLRISHDQAERLKVGEKGRCVAEEQEKRETLMLLGDLSIGDRSIRQHAVCQILESRASELVSLVRERLGPGFDPQQLGAGIILTGGGSRLKRLPDLASRVLGAPARVFAGRANIMESVSAPEFTAALGLLHYGVMALQESANERAAANKGGSKLFKMAQSLFQR